MPYPPRSLLRQIYTKYRSGASKESIHGLVMTVRNSAMVGWYIISAARGYWRSMRLECGSTVDKSPVILSQVKWPRYKCSRFDNLLTSQAESRFLWSLSLASSHDGARVESRHRLCMFDHYHKSLTVNSSEGLGRWDTWSHQSAKLKRCSSAHSALARSAKIYKVWNSTIHLIRSHAPDTKGLENHLHSYNSSEISSWPIHPVKNTINASTSTNTAPCS